MAPKEITDRTTNDGKMFSAQVWDNYTELIAEAVGIAMRNVSTYDLPLDIARGVITGSQAFGAYGEITTAGAVTKNVIWPDGVFNIPNQTTGEAITFVSSSVEDAVGGTGVSAIEVHYLDVNLAPQTLAVTLTGTTPVTGLLTGCRFIQCMHITTVGSAGSAVGQIDAYQAGTPATIYSLIAAGAERCTSSMRMVPAGKKCIVKGAVVSAVSITADAYAVTRIIASEIDTHQYIDPFIFIPQGSIGAQNNGIGYVFPVPFIFNAGTIVGGRVTTNKACTVSYDWFGWLEDV